MSDSIRDRIVELLTGRSQAAANYRALQGAFNMLNETRPGGAPGYLEGQNMPMKNNQYMSGQDPRELMSRNITEQGSDDWWLKQQRHENFLRDYGFADRGDI
jgi:hypothetical protein